MPDVSHRRDDALRDSVATGASLANGAGEPVLATRSLVKRFGGVAAVDGVSLSVGANQIVGLIGPNGAGKTTLFDLVAGDLKPTRGDIVLAGRSVELLPPHRRVEYGLTRTFQIPRPFHAMTVVENVMLGAQRQSGERIAPNWLEPRKVAAEERVILEKAMALLEFLTIAHMAREPARVLSGGQRKLLELARVLMTEPRVLLLDEPAAGVNPSLLEIIIDRIAAINRRGVAMLVIEHNMQMISRLCDHVYVLAEGRLLCEGRPQAVVRDPRVIEAYLGGRAA